MQQLELLSYGLEPLALNQRVRVNAENWDGVIAQIWPGRDWYAVFAWDIPGRGIADTLPTFRRDELEAYPLLDDEAECEARRRICRPQSTLESNL